MSAPRSTDAETPTPETGQHYILTWHDGVLRQAGPFASDVAAVQFGVTWQGTNGDNPCWQSLYGDDPLTVSMAPVAPQVRA